MIFADEPTGNLDPESEKMVMDLLKKINEEQDTTMIVVTHREKLASYANLTIRMDKGAIISAK